MQMQLTVVSWERNFFCKTKEEKSQRKHSYFVNLFLRQHLRSLVGKSAFFKFNTCWPLLPCRCLI